jgi:hypothetical protein
MKQLIYITIILISGISSALAMTKEDFIEYLKEKKVGL